MKKLRLLPPSAHLARLESCGSEELLAIFETCFRSGSKRPPYNLLPAAWGHLFSDLFLSAEELVDAMQRGEMRLDRDDLQMLREFIRADCTSGGSFVLNVIANGGKIDRAALIMVADLEGLAAIEYKDKTAIQLLVEACDKKVRPLLIRKAGKKLLSQVFDRRDLPLLFTIFALCDISEEDLHAIASVLSQDELKSVMSRSRTGKNGLEIFINVYAAIKRYPKSERNALLVRNAFYVPAAKDAQEDEPDLPVRVRKISSLPRNKTE